MNVVTRFAPSPTGNLHAGSYRTALFAYIFAKQNKGKFILRIEDTDKARSKKEYEDNILDSLKWLGLDHDEFYRQSERTELYKKYIKRLIDTGHAYASKETPKEPGDRDEVIRFKNPNKKVAFDDLIRGKVEFDTTELGDFVIAKDMNEPVFHLVNVVDDYEMGMTHIIRGEDHISNTPRQILIYEALDAPVPKFAHIPLLLSTDRSKLSKRHGAVPVSDYRAKGYLPGALVNYMALLGWHPQDDREILSLEDIISAFTLERVQKGGAVFDDEKLLWFNRQYMQACPPDLFKKTATEFLPEQVKKDTDLIRRIMPVLKEKLSHFGEIRTMMAPEGELAFVVGTPSYTADKLLWKKNPDKGKTVQHLTEARKLLAGVDEKTFDAESVKAAVWPYADANGRGDVLWPLRISLTGQDKSPDPFSCASILGKPEALNRIDAALKLLSA